MSNAHFIRGLVLALVLACTLPACAVYEKCGLKGCPGDAEITAQVQAALNQHSALQSMSSIGVQTLDHVVYLTGILDTGQEISIAESVARQVPGVTSVVNSIVVRNPAY